jgi:dCTP deaminase
LTVKSDRWIRRIAEEHPLIQPFEAALVREQGGRRIVSAGASSYGYDMRLADDGFRVFSPTHGREIDPTGICTRKSTYARFSKPDLPRGKCMCE